MNNLVDFHINATHLWHFIWQFQILEEVLELLIVGDLTANVPLGYSITFTTVFLIAFMQEWAFNRSLLSS